MSTVPLERLGYRGVLSLDCRDAVSGTVVSGLVAEAWPRTDPRARRTARRSPTSQLLGFGTLPDHPLEQRVRAPGEGPLDWPAATSRPYRVLVTDPRRRYLPVLTDVTAPQAAPHTVTLHAAPTSLPRGGWAVVRGQVLRAGGPRPLPWAVLTIELAGRAHTARCDAAGVFLLNAPYPEALPPLFGSPPSGPGLSTMTWTVEIGISSAPDTLTFTDPQHPDVPDTASVIGQAQATFDPGGGPTLTRTLTFGEVLALSLTATPA